MKNLNKASNAQIILVFCLGVFGILSTELGMMGILPIVSKNFYVSISDAGWCECFCTCVICINAGIWGFYSYFSDFLHSVGKMNFTLILTFNHDRFYILLFSFYSEIMLIIFAFIFRILGGVMNNGTHFMRSHPFPKTADFSNGLFISSQYRIKHRNCYLWTCDFFE